MIAKSAIRTKIFQNILNACPAITLRYPLDVDIILQILSRITFTRLSVLEFWTRSITCSFINHGNRLIWSINHVNHSWLIEDSIHSNRVINDWSSSFHRLKKNGTRIMNQDSINIRAIRYVIRIHNHLLFVSLCQNTMHHSKAREIINPAITMYIYDNDIYIMYHNTTIASQISQNLSICFVIFIDWETAASWSFSIKWSVDLSIVGAGKRLS